MGRSFDDERRGRSSKASHLFGSIEAFDAHKDVNHCRREPFDQDCPAGEPSRTIYGPTITEGVVDDGRSNLANLLAVCRQAHVDPEAKVFAASRDFPHGVICFSAGLAELEIRGPDLMRKRSYGDRPDKEKLKNEQSFHGRFTPACAFSPAAGWGSSTVTM